MLTSFEGGIGGSYWSTKIKLLRWTPILINFNLTVKNEKKNWVGIYLKNLYKMRC